VSLVHIIGIGWVQTRGSIEGGVFQVMHGAYLLERIQGHCDADDAEDRPDCLVGHGRCVRLFKTSAAKDVVQAEVGKMSISIKAYQPSDFAEDLLPNGLQNGRGHLGHPKGPEVCFS
jgi:hypothetical protein